ncbi:hypothetical protein HMPREF3185_00596 [Porphyromonas somerae]|uniref:Uncharacterized protein n=1 Tax=Porphyromonas somerae TaxID=322095 RepID=A0A134BAW0_9PORP|nr:hypothetical protein HMPREF3184_00596 [Porphyromonadaceae bacterium KA00676]KXB77082.1 hypothetical protein HMPREF3185_00596 [Porphyromonas somerae]
MYHTNVVINSGRALSLRLYRRSSIPQLECRWILCDTDLYWSVG